MVTIIFIFIFGLIIGSFLSALTWRLPRGEDFVSERSKCDRCGKLIEWYDNIPLFSYLILGGKCRNCRRKISFRYPLMEFSTAVLFVLVTTFKSPTLQGVYGYWNYMNIAYYLLLTTILIAIFIIDFELQIIPDELIYVLLFTTFSWLLFTSNDQLYLHLLSGFIAALFILCINFATRGRGMGLGDVKLALFGGLFFSFPEFITWLFLSFIIGAVIGVLLISLGKAKFGKHIAFGPFLVISFFITLFWGNILTSVFLPYL